MPENVNLTIQVAMGIAPLLLLIVFGIWVYRKIELRSLPSAFAYLILVLLYGLIFYRFVQPQFASPHVWIGKPLDLYPIYSQTWDTANKLLLVVLLLADCAFVIAKAGADLTGRFARMWRWIYDKSTFFGWVLVASLLLKIFWMLKLWGVL